MFRNNNTVDMDAENPLIQGNPVSRKRSMDYQTDEVLNLDEEICGFQSKKVQKIEQEHNIIRSTQEVEDEWDKMMRNENNNENGNDIDNDNDDLFEDSDDKFSDQAAKMENLLEKALDNFYKKLHVCIKEGLERVEDNTQSTDEKVETIMKCLKEDDRTNGVDYGDINIILGGDAFKNLTKHEHRFKRQEHAELGHRAMSIQQELKLAEENGFKMISISHYRWSRHLLAKPYVKRYTQGSKVLVNKATETPIQGIRNDKDFNRICSRYKIQADLVYIPSPRNFLSFEQIFGGKWVDGKLTFDGKHV